MAKRRKAVKMVGPLQAMSDRAAAEGLARPTVNEHAAQHGVYETHCSDFSSALTKVKSHGWTVVKQGSIWRHFCRDCA